MSLDFALLARSRKLCFFSVLEGGKGPCFCCIPAPLPDKGVLDFITHCPMIQVFYGSQMSGPHHPPSIPLPQINTTTTLPTRYKSYLETTFRTPVPITPAVNPTISAYIPVFTMTHPTTSTPSRFVVNTKTLEDVLKTKTVGHGHLSKFTRRRVELVEQRDRQAA